MSRRTIWSILCTLCVRAGYPADAWLTWTLADWQRLTRGRPN